MDVKLFRRRYIPNEKVLLENDIILEFSDEIIVTKWDVLKPRKDFSYGYSTYFIKEGFKVSRMFNEYDKCIYVYCDIVEIEINEKEYTFNDLLVDVIIYENGFVRLLDLKEIPEALDENLITIEQLKKSMNSLDKLLSIIYAGKLKELTSHIDGQIMKEKYYDTKE